jgi:hypothetical protein
MAGTDAGSFAAAVTRANRANDEMLGGRAGPLKELFSHGPDISLFGGFGGHERGWDEIGPRLDWVAQTFLGGRCDYREVLSSSGADHGFVVQFERGEAKIAGRTEPLRIDFRVTMAFRREDGVWRLVHRHADPLVEKQKP